MFKAINCYVINKNKIMTIMLIKKKHQVVGMDAENVKQLSKSRYTFQYNNSNIYILGGMYILRENISN
jgi:hypothetical protein